MRPIPSLFTAKTSVGELARRQETVLLSVLAGLSALSVLTQVLQLLRLALQPNFHSVFWWLMNALFLLMMFYLARLTRSGGARVAAAILIALLGVFALMVLLGDGVRNPMWSMVFAMCVVLGTLLLGLHAGLIAAAVGGGAALSVSVLQAADAFTPFFDTDAETSVINGAGSCIVLTFLAGISILYSRDPGRSINELVADGSPASPLLRVRTATLSVREVEVVRLVAEGLTDREVAGRLFISPRTAQAHVQNALRKTETANRTALGVLAVREGLAPTDTDTDTTPETLSQQAGGPALEA